MAATIDALKRRILRADAEALDGIERDLLSALADEWIGRLPGAVNAVLADVAMGVAAGTFTEGDLARVLERVREALVVGLVDRVTGAVGSAITGAYDLGRDEILRPLQLALSLSLVDKHAREVLRSDTLFWVGSAWDRVLGKVVSDTIREEVIEKGLSRKDAAAELERILGADFPGRSRAYWETVAAAGVVRARSFGNIESFVQAEAETYQWLAIGDARTCPICSQLDGRMFQVSAAVQQRDAFLAAESPEAAKAAHPWVKEADVAGKNTDELAAAGILMPPIHARCRCTLVVGRFAGE